MKPVTPTNKRHVMTFVARGDRDLLLDLRLKLRIAAITRGVTLSDLLVSILLNYVTELAEQEVRS